MSRFDTVIVVDWSSRSKPGPRSRTADSIWIGIAEDGAEATYYMPTRHAAMEFLAPEIARRLDAGQRVLAGFDFPFGYPKGTARRIAGSDDPFALWDWLSERIEDGPDNSNNRFLVADEINAGLPGIGPFWGRPANLDLPHLPARGRLRRDHGFTERRICESRIATAQPVWKLFTTGSVGSQTLVGVPRLNALRARFGAACSVWPFEAHETPLVLAEVYPSLLRQEVHATLAAEPDAITDEVQVRLLSRALYGMSREGALAGAFEVPEVAREEAWILGLGHERDLARHATSSGALRPELTPPPLRNDCFALPPGVDWVPVDDALTHLRAALSARVAVENLPLARAAGRILAEDAVARRANPPLPNSAVDGYGFAHQGRTDDSFVLPLLEGRAAAGVPFTGTVPTGSAIRVLTGATLPDGVDTVVLEEDCTVGSGHVAFRGPVKPRANTRRAGEDVEADAPVARKGTRLGPPELAILAATGIDRVEAFTCLRVGVLSTGDELSEPGDIPRPGDIFDANRPMLLSLLRGWGYEARDLGIAADERSAVRAALDRGAATCHAILTSGGASAGDEDHISAILRAEGHVTDWRIALKPGRPLMLGTWKGVPVFGMPGNPVAALVCALVFARPALSVMAGGPWLDRVGVSVPAAFSKRKKPGRREFLRARLTSDGHAEVFRSEGSGRISGLAWATGLVEIEDGERDIQRGDLVWFLPYSMLGMNRP